MARPENQIDNLDEVIEKITSKVVERLSQMGLGHAASQVRQVIHESACTQDPEVCSGCGKCPTHKKEATDNIIHFGASRISTSPGFAGQVDTKLAGMIDHTILKADATRDELSKVCKEARDYNFATVCVNAVNIPFVARLLQGSNVKPIAVVGFPLGAETSEAKAFEAKEAVRNGAREIDMVINAGALKSKDYATVFQDIKAVVEASKPYPVKVILETGGLEHDEKVIGCALSKTAGAAFVKTSTGFGKGGAMVEDIALMRRIVGDDMQVKASGGVRTKEDAEAMVKAGANRIGASASVAIVTGKKAKVGNY